MYRDRTLVEKWCESNGYALVKLNRSMLEDFELTKKIIKRTLHVDCTRITKLPYTVFARYLLIDFLLNFYSRNSICLMLNITPANGTRAKQKLDGLHKGQFIYYEDWEIDAFKRTQIEFDKIKEIMKK